MFLNKLLKIFYFTDELLNKLQKFKLSKNILGTYLKSFQTSYRFCTGSHSIVHPIKYSVFHEYVDADYDERLLNRLLI